MTLQEGYDYLNTVLNKDQSGNSLSPDEYNVLLEAHIFDFVKAKVLEHRSFVTQGGTDEVIFTSSLLDSLSTQSVPTITSGTFPIPNDLLYVESMYGTYNANRKQIEVVSPTERARRQANAMSKPVAYYPIAIITDTTCRFFPANVTAITLNYVKKPTIPVYDYYVDANYNIQYLAASATHVLTTGERGSAGQTSGTTVTSLTVELNISEDTHVQFFNYILDKIAIRDRDPLLYQAAQNEKNKP